MVLSPVGFQKVGLLHADDLGMDTSHYDVWRGEDLESRAHGFDSLHRPSVVDCDGSFKLDGRGKGKRLAASESKGEECGHGVRDRLPFQGQCLDMAVVDQFFEVLPFGLNLLEDGVHNPDPVAEPLHQVESTHPQKVEERRSVRDEKRFLHLVVEVLPHLLKLVVGVESGEGDKITEASA